MHPIVGGCHVIEVDRHAVWDIRHPADVGRHADGGSGTRALSRCTRSGVERAPRETGGAGTSVNCV